MALELVLHCIECQESITIPYPQTKLGVEFECPNCGAFNFLTYDTGHFEDRPVPFDHYYFSDVNVYGDGEDDDWD